MTSFDLREGLAVQREGPNRHQCQNQAREIKGGHPLAEQKDPENGHQDKLRHAGQNNTLSEPDLEQFGVDEIADGVDAKRRAQ